MRWLSCVVRCCDAELEKTTSTYGDLGSQRKTYQTRMSRWLGGKHATKRVSTWKEGFTQPITLRIYNNGSSEVEACWVKYDGELQQYGTIKPGRMLPISSFNTHVWCLKVAGQRDLFYVGGSAVLSVQPKGQLHVLLDPDSFTDDEDDSSWMKPEWGQYKQRGSVLGIPIMAYECVCQAAVDHLSCCISHMMATADPAVMGRIIQAGCKLAIIGKHQVTTDIPAHRFMRHQGSEGGRDIDATTRGLGATHAVPTASCGEENLTMQHDTRYPQESILVHEFAHAVMNLGFDEQQQACIQRLYKQAQQQCIYDKECYMMDNADEYWAEASQVWFGATVRTDVTSGINTRKLLQTHDPRLCELLSQVYGFNTWQYTDSCPGEFHRPAEQARPHRQQAPTEGNEQAMSLPSRYWLRSHAKMEGPAPQQSAKKQKTSRMTKKLFKLQ